ncbi:UDP-N-acetylmuramate--L-alanine ligase [Mesoterricola silvestris]|uniref:UDP-N-acetylmuramate--L-alanine ligase n=1 Tax=Mesoterricola silvestris TaxID=2927979 RepID=A0AA48GPW0_9BACT|nr:UDP-N-acetylmuramate--L-alanine ligase [Mesoterricola silvestris]BDU71807.1 UDP-N-acetylmuramate--L-alanine ligase [Mesoterricola silvestris]
MFGKIQHIHFVGIGGIGMSGIAEVLVNLGYQVSGSDLRESAVTQRLSSLGVQVALGHDAKCIEGAQVVVISSAVKGDNPEVVAARAAKIPVIPRGEMLAELMRMKYGIAIAGSHGKTTTTSMVAQVLSQGGIDPTIVIGGKLGAIGSNAKLGKGPFLVAEADESDGSFLLLSPTIGVITNVDREHLDHYRDLGEIMDAFAQFGNKVPFYGSVFVCMDDPNVAMLRPRLKRQVRTYGTNPQVDIRALDIRMEGWRALFRVRAFGEDLGEFSIGVPGHHMVLNALATIGVALELGVERDVIRASLASFTGADRRFQKKGERKGVTVIDDYGHHPTEIAATLAAARKGFPDKRIVVAFQPHRYSRTQALLEEFGRAFFDADVVLVTDIYAASEPPIPGLTGRSVVDAILAHGQRNAAYVPRVEDLAATLDGLTEAGDLVVTMGAGTITTAGPAYLALP